MDQILAFYHLIQQHPLYWQVPLALITTSGIFDWVKRQLALEGKARITALLSLLSIFEVIIHAAIVGLTFASPLGLAKYVGTQSLFYVGGLTIVYNFLTSKVTKLLLDAKAEAANAKTTSQTTPAQTSQPKLPAADAGVTTF